jgi:hypothetical protein
MTNLDRAILLVLIVTLAAGAALAQTAAQPASGPFATKAVVTAKADGKALSLKREEQIALMFLQSIDFLLDDCRSGSAEPCTLAALVRGPKQKGGDFGVGKLKFDPNATDPNYTYKLTVSDDNSEWQIWATPKKPGLGSFYGKGKFFGGRFYKAAGGTASAEDVKLTEVGVDGDLFHTMG